MESEADSLRGRHRVARLRRSCREPEAVPGISSRASLGHPRVSAGGFHGYGPSQVPQVRERRRARVGHPDKHQASPGDSGPSPHGNDRGRRAHRLPDAGEPLVRPLLRHDAGRARLRRSAGGQRFLQAIRCGRSPTARLACCRSIRTRPTSGSSSSKISRTAGRTSTRRGTAASTTSGCRPRAPRRWRTSPGRTFRSSSPSPTRSPSATRTTARSWGRPIPNRYHMWTGWVGNDGKGGGPVLDNAEAGYDWSTYPERLQKAGITWKIYQDAGAGLDAAHFWGWGDDAYIGNYGDNSLLYFHQYQNSQPGSPLFEGALTGTNISQGGTLFDVFRQDVAGEQAPAGLVDRRSRGVHRASELARELRRLVRLAVPRRADGESGGLEQDRALLDVRRERRLLRSHGPARRRRSRARRGCRRSTRPTRCSRATPSTRRAPYGLGFRVPMIVISPWSKGGWVDSEVFDHTSLIRFIEQRFGREYPGLIGVEHHRVAPRRRRATSRRRSTSGRPTTPVLLCRARRATSRRTTTGTRTTRPCRRRRSRCRSRSRDSGPRAPVPYELHVVGETDVSDGSVKIYFGNTGRSAAVFQVRSGDGQNGPWTYTVGSGAYLSDTWTFGGDGPDDVRSLGLRSERLLARVQGERRPGERRANLAVVSAYERSAERPGNHAGHPQSRRGGRAR